MGLGTICCLDSGPVLHSRRMAGVQPFVLKEEWGCIERVPEVMVTLWSERVVDIDLPQIVRVAVRYNLIWHIWLHELPWIFAAARNPGFGVFSVF